MHRVDGFLEAHNLGAHEVRSPKSAYLRHVPAAQSPHAVAGTLAVSFLVPLAAVVHEPHASAAATTPVPASAISTAAKHHILVPHARHI